ncbi:response regulator transcription factor [Myxococcota bacterium]|nr:response regulator transcription factor [Myxococcota bacterium]
MTLAISETLHPSVLSDWNEASPPRVVLVEEQPAYRRALGELVEESLHFIVVGEASDGSAASELTDTLGPDLVLVSAGGDHMDSVSVTRRLVSEHPDLRVIAVSMYRDRQYAEAMMNAGASAHVMKDRAHEELPLALEAIACGSRFVTSELR